MVSVLALAPWEKGIAGEQGSGIAERREARFSGTSRGAHRAKA